MPRRVRLQVGDVVRVPLDSKRWGAAQVVGKVEPLLFYFAGFAGGYGRDDSPGLVEATAGVPALLALTMDVLVRHGEWSVIGRARVNYDDVMLPVFKSQRGPGTWALMDYSCSLERVATRDEVDSFPFRRDSAPVIFEEAMAAANGMGPLGEYDALRPVPPERSSQAIFGVPVRQGASAAH